MIERLKDSDTWSGRDAEVESYFRGLQHEIVTSMEDIEGTPGSFIRDEWTREGGGGGLTCVLQGGGIFEKVGIGFSRVEGPALPESASARRDNIGGQPFCGMGVSLVAHPLSPRIPTAHMNVRFFRTRSATTGEVVWWFGGGYDLTPYYGYAEDCAGWHRTAKSVCEKHYDGAMYEKLKKWCDDYFFIKHRNCLRGIGGIFFDDFSEPDFSHSFAFLKDVGRSFMPAYEPIILKRQDQEYTDKERDFQLYRRGRYVEFNLVYDRGTLFGLQSGGRVESILMSMPPLVRFDYGWENEPGSPEALLETDFLVPKDWASYKG